MGQNLFNFDEPETPTAVITEAYSWEWQDAWPAGLSDRESHLMQIRRDMRAVEECEDDERPFFLGRIAAFREAIKRMDGDERGSQQTQSTAAPGE